MPTPNLEQPLTPPANPPVPPNPSIEPIEELFRRTMAENEQRARVAEARTRELEDQLNARKREERSTPEVPHNVTKEQFWEDPVTNISKLIEAQIKPLRETAAHLDSGNAYAQMKNGYRSQFPAFAKIESKVDEFMQGREVSHAEMQIAIQRAVGHIMMTNPSLLQESPAPNNNTPTPPAPNNSQIPPNPTPSIPAHLRPSPPAPIVDDKTPKRRPLTELERRVMKEMKIDSEEKYWELLESSAKVDSWRKPA